VTGIRGTAAYGAAKLAVRGFSESLRHELAKAKSPVRLSSCTPGSSHQHRAQFAGRQWHYRQRPPRRDDQAVGQVAKDRPRATARRIIASIETNEPPIPIGSDVRFMDLLLQRFRPAVYWSVMARRIERMAKTAE